MDIRAIKETISRMAKERNLSTTYWVVLDRLGGGIWAVVFGWVDGFDNDEGVEYQIDNCRLCGKVAYLPGNSGMSEYDMDWLMPYDSTGDVYDSELSVDNEADVLSSISFWGSEWDNIAMELDKGRNSSYLKFMEDNYMFLEFEDEDED